MTTLGLQVCFTLPEIPAVSRLESRDGQEEDIKAAAGNYWGQLYPHRVMTTVVPY